MLVFEKGFDDDNVFVLYYDGDDYYTDGLAPRYNADESHPAYYPITDYSATKTNAENVFNGLAYGTGGFPLVTQDDFLFVWTFGHGQFCGEIEYNPCLALYSNALTDIELAALVNPIPAHKKVYWMQNCFGGLFADNLAATNAIFHSAGTDESGTIEEQTAAPADNYWDTENEIINSVIYQHGEFNFHVYSSTMGESPAYSNSYGNEQYSEADLNNDNYISIYESWTWEQSHETKEEVPLYSDIGNIGIYTSLLYPTLLHTNIITNETHRGLIGVSKTIHITNGNELVLKSNSDVHLLNHSDMVVDAGATLTIGDSVEIIGGNGKIEVNGNIVVGLGVKFEETVLDLLNSGLQTTFNTTTFGQSSVNNYGKNFDVVNSYFDNCGVINSYYGDINISYSDFSQSSIYCELPQSSSVKRVTVKGCEFLNQTSLSAIDILSYQNFSIDSNTITNFYNGIQLAQSGSGMAGNQNVLQNEISGATNAAIRLYNTTATLGNNYVYDNNFGLRLFDNCNVALDGNYAASGYDETNFVTDNDSYEIYASSGSFPWYFRYNVIIDEDNLGNPTDPMVYYDITGGGTLIDVKYNCWGNSFNQTADLYPSGYMVNPQLCPSSGGDKSSDVVLQIYLDGLEHFENEEFSDAREIFKEVIEQYPQTTYAPTAMKVLLAVEKVDGNNFNQLQQYYNTADSIQANPVLTKLAGYLSTKCEIEMQNWQTAIDYFEDIIENPDNPEDSIFAIIDLGYTYFLMENSGMKAGITGTMFQHKPQSKQSFAATRDTLLALLPFKKSAENKIDEITNKRIGELLQNIPNPFTGQTTIYFNLQEQAQVVLQIYDHLGKTVKQIEIPDAKEGENSLTIELKNVPGGMYFCSLFVNGKQVDTKKMVVK
jgi:tetratricopeptide (TPR) repeat protein